MESSAAVGNEFGGGARSVDASRGKRVAMLVAAAIVPFAAAFGIGIATKSTSAPTATGSLAPSVSVTAQSASITGLHAAPAVPSLKAAPKKATKAATVTPTSASTSASSSSSNSVAQTPVQSAPVQSAPAPAPTPTPTPTKSSSSPTTSHGGG